MAEKLTPTRKVSDKSTKQELLEACETLKVQEIAEKTIESAGHAKMSADLQKLLVDQGRKAAAEK